MSFIINWLNPPSAPTIAENIEIVIKYLDVKAIITKKGATFCHVKIKIFCVQFKPTVTWGNQKWKGAAPNFIEIEEINSNSIASKVIIL